MEAAQDIKARLDIADLIQEYLPLKPAGTGTFKACCPFHQEKTPSFYVSRSRQTWHCFGCDQGGDAFSFVERMEGMDFREALEFLAAKTGVTLPKFDAAQSSLRKRLQEVTELAVKFFRASLMTLPASSEPRQYLANRGLDDLTADLFRLGYAPDGWSNLTEALLKQGVTADELLKAGLAIPRERGSGVYDRFRHRLMFPIADVHGRVVGFTGRVLSSDKKEAKYVNTPETLLYRKSAILYGLDKAKGEIRRQDQAVIVEGNMDVIASHQFGVTNVVASSGTALTDEQLSLIKRFTTNLSIAFDQDDAGQAATLRGLDLARAKDFSIKIITLPPEAGKDPDEAVRKNPEFWKQAIAQATGIVEWVYRQAFKTHRGTTAEEKKMIAHQILPEIKRIADPVERDHWIKRLAKDLMVGEQALLESMGRPSTSPSPLPSRRIEPLVSPSTKKDIREEQEKRLMAAFLISPDNRPLLLDELSFAPSELRDPQLAALYAFFASGYSVSEQSRTSRQVGGPSIKPPDALPPELSPLFDALAFLAEREFSAQGVEQIKSDLRATVVLLRQARVTEERQKLEAEMRAAERADDQDQIKLLAKRFQELN